MPALARDRYSCPKCLAVFRQPAAYCPIDGTPVVEHSSDPFVGTKLAGRYQIERCVGRGGMGRVYRAQHLRMSRRFAVKILYGEVGIDPKMRVRFIREANAASQLDHPNVVSVLDFGEATGGLLYLVMDYVEGRELSAIIAREAPLPATRVHRILRQLCAGLAHAHDNGLIHRDFKGDNIMITELDGAEQARIVDFGISVSQRPVEEVSRLTTAGIVLGTIAYMSPEQATGAPLDHRSDLFSLGIVLYEMLSGVKPFNGSAAAIMQQKVVTRPPWIRHRVAGLQVDHDLEQIARKLLQRSPEDRFQSCHEILEFLDTLHVGTTTHTLVLDPLYQVTTENLTTTRVRVRSASRRSFTVVRAAMVTLVMMMALLVNDANVRGDRSGNTMIQSSAMMQGRQTVTGRAEQDPYSRGAEADSADSWLQLEADPVLVGEPASTFEIHDDRSHRKSRNAVRHRRRCSGNCDKQARRSSPGQLNTTRLARRRIDSSGRIDADAIDLATLLAFYRQVGHELDDTAGRDGSVANRRLYQRYMGISILDVQRTPGLREDVYSQLLDIHRELVNKGQKFAITSR